MPTAPYEQITRSLTKQPGVEIETFSYSDAYETLLSAARAYKVGRKIRYPLGNIPTDAYVLSVNLQRSSGLRGVLTVSMSRQEPTMEVIGMDYMEVQKNIKTWHQNSASATKPDLSKIAQWEDQKTYKNENAYNNYLYDGTRKLTGESLMLAQMIREDGIEYYSTYTPMITSTARLNTIPTDIGANIGKINTPTSSDPDNNLTDIVKCAAQWLKTGDRIAGALDGTYTRIQTWTGADQWNANLYT
ncbi:MAG: hypothetical protein RR996_01810 [Alistipes sp.]